MKRFYLIIFVALFLLGSITAVYLLTNKHTTESTITITGKVMDQESGSSGLVYEDNFVLGDIDVRDNPLVILDNITLTTDTTREVTFIYYPNITNLDSECDFENDINITPYLLTGKNTCIDFCQAGYTPLMAYQETLNLIENNSVLTIENIDLNRIQVKIDIKKNACNQKLYLKTELIPM